MNTRLRVLNVEDSENDAALINRHLSLAGYDVHAHRVETSSSLRSALESQEWDIILCDYALPGFDALTALSALRESELDIPFVVISGTVDELGGVAAMKAGANDYFLKNNLVRLGPTIERELQEAENRRRRKHAEEALKDSEKELRALFAAMTDIVFELDADGRYLKIAPTNPAYFYKPPDELIGKTLYEVFSKKDADLYLEHIHEALSTGSVVRLEYNLDINGEDVWFDASVSPMTEDSVIWISRDITEQKKAEQQRRLGERRLAEAQKLARLGSWDWDLENDVMIWSDGHYHIFGVEPGSFDVSSKPAVESYIHPDDRALVSSCAKHSIETHEPFNFDYRIVRPDGEERIIHSCGSVELNIDGRPIRMFGTAQDTTDERRADSEQSRLTSELEGERMRLRDIVASVPGVVWEVWGRPDEGNQKIDFVSDYVEDLLGYSVEEWLSVPNFWLSIVHPDDRERIIREAREFYAKGTENTMEFRWVTLDGRSIWVESRSIIIRDEKGESVGMRAVTTNVSERKEAEQLLLEQKEILQQIFEHVPVMMCFFGQDGQPKLVNKEWERVRGWSQVEATNGYLNILDKSYPDPIERQKARDAISEATGKWTEFKTASKDGQIKDCLWAVVKLSDGTRVGIGQDITDRKRAEEALHESELQLRQVQKMEAIGRLAGGIAHDFNNLLTVITGYSDLTLKRMPADDPFRRNSEEIRKAGERAAALTRQLLAFSRKQVLQPKILDINSVIVEMEGMLQRLLGEDIELCTAVLPDTGQVKADPGQIEQVIMNLAINARDAMPRGGQVVIETENVRFDKRSVEAEPGNYVMITFSDTGVGMDAETQSQIFDPFFTTKPVGKGTGLGLSTVYGIVNQSGGYIKVDSEVGAGTTFRIYLPRVDEDYPETVLHSDALPKLEGRETILLAEDEDVVRNLAREVLESYGYTVIAARNGEDAISVCDDHNGSIDLLVSDVVMPGMGGRELRDELVPKHQGMKVLFMSGYTDDAIVRYGVLESKVPFIQKPFTPDGLAAKVREVLDNA
jgi:two-component system cell cycle sensor histidine kinase/response regulator CckA